MKFMNWLPVMLLAACLGCSKKDSGTVETPTNIAPIQDPVSWDPILTQTNSNAMQYNYGRVKLVKGMSAVMTNLSAANIGSYSLHVYLKTGTGNLIHLPNNSVGGVAYNYYQKSANPSSTMYITRGAGVEETYEGIVILVGKLTYIQTFSPAINFNDYGSAKTKLGF